ncbi:uncharacterized protein LOC103315323 [Nasonia vitripennis]|uniref:DUF7041 domain-containing protein n=1 Tax=Nasonia vitripennis TaxID=7425 RepID=A0A7M7R0P9_NASVI|nr:uncharacterized protein LOC103315323 [Nasonia vitripennis]
MPETGDVSANSAPVVNMHTPRNFRAPPFLENKIKDWFTLLEAQFVTAGITDDNIKYCNTISSLTERAINQMEDVLTEPPDTDKYTDLKTKMVERFTESDGARVRKLLEGEQIGDRKPSEFFRALKAHATANTSEEFILELWKTRLPSQLQTVMAASSETAVDKILKLADTVHEITPSKQVNAVNDMSGLFEQIQKLTIQVNALTQDRSRSRARGASRAARSRPSTPASARIEPTELCFYHRRFKERATKCRSPCTWSGNDARRQ